MNAQSKITSFFCGKKNDNFNRRLRCKLEETPEVVDITSSDDELLSLSITVDNFEVFDSKSKTPKLEPSCSNLEPTPVRTECTPTKQSILPITVTPTKSDSAYTDSPQRYTVYTPSRKKYIKRVKRRINAAKMNLLQRLSENPNTPKYDNDDYRRACQQQDDPTKFLLDIVQAYVLDESMHHLLDEKQHNLIINFLKLQNSHAIKIFSKVFWLQWKWKRAEDMIKKYSTKDVENSSQDGLSLLCDEGYIDQGSKAMSLEEWLTILKKPELVTVCKSFKIDCKNAGKDKLIKDLHAYCSKKSNTLDTFFALKKGIQKERTNLTHGRVVQKIGSVVGECFKLSTAAKSAFDRLHLLMYLGLDFQVIREKKLILLLLNVKTGKESFPSLSSNIDNHHRIIFPTYQHFTIFEEAHLLYEECVEVTNTKDSDHNKVIELARKAFDQLKVILANDFSVKWSLPEWLQRFTPYNKYIKVIELGIVSLKTQKSKDAYKESLGMLEYLISQSAARQHKLSHWYSEKALILHSKFGLHSEAANILIAGLNDTRIPHDDKEPLRERADRLVNLKTSKLGPEITNLLGNMISFDRPNLPKKEIYSQALEGNSSGKKACYEIWMNEGGKMEKAYASVEDYAIMQYVKEGQYSTGLHVEGRLVVNIFLLLFWDIIYTQPINAFGMFLSKYQHAPLDMHTNHFYLNRKQEIDERLSFIEASDMATLLFFVGETYQNRPEGEVSLLNTSIIFDAVEEVMNCLRPQQLSALCRRLVKSFNYTYSGFPDITLWNAKTNKVKFVEVKGQGDRLSIKQIQWITYLLEHGIDAEVCYVGKKYRKVAGPKKTSNL